MEITKEKIMILFIKKYLNEWLVHIHSDTFMIEVFSVLTALNLARVIIFPTLAQVTTVTLLALYPYKWMWAGIFLSAGIVQGIAVLMMNLRLRKIGALVSLCVWTWMLMVLLLSAKLILIAFFICVLCVTNFIAYLQLWKKDV